MEQKGYVTEVTGSRVKVRIDRKSACGGNCASCGGCPSNAHIIECNTRASLAVGEEVRLVMSSHSFFKRIFWGYGQITILTVAGAVLGYALFKKEGASALGAMIGLCMGLLIARLVYRNPDGEIEAQPIYNK